MSGCSDATEGRRFRGVVVQIRRTESQDGIAAHAEMIDETGVKVSRDRTTLHWAVAFGKSCSNDKSKQRVRACGSSPARQYSDHVATLVDYITSLGWHSSTTRVIEWHAIKPK